MSVSIQSLLKCGLITVAATQSMIANADSVSQDLQSCAVAALAEREQSAKMDQVKTDGMKLAELDHDTSLIGEKYLMSIIDKSSGK